MKCELKNGALVIYADSKKSVDSLTNWYYSENAQISVDTSKFDNNFDAEVECPELYIKNQNGDFEEKPKSKINSVQILSDGEWENLESHLGVKLNEGENITGASSGVTVENHNNIISIDEGAPNGDASAEVTYKKLDGGEIEVIDCKVTNRKSDLQKLKSVFDDIGVEYVENKEFTESKERKIPVEKIFSGSNIEIDSNCMDCYWLYFNFDENGKFKDTE